MNQERGRRSSTRAYPIARQASSGGPRRSKRRSGQPPTRRPRANSKERRKRGRGRMGKRNIAGLPFTAVRRGEQRHSSRPGMCGWWSDSLPAPHTCHHADAKRLSCLETRGAPTGLPAGMREKRVGGTDALSPGAASRAAQRTMKVLRASIQMRPAEVTRRKMGF